MRESLAHCSNLVKNKTHQVTVFTIVCTVKEKIDNNIHEKSGRLTMKL